MDIFELSLTGDGLSPTGPDLTGGNLEGPRDPGQGHEGPSWRREKRGYVNDVRWKMNLTR
jgi:hypothetical protein